MKSLRITGLIISCLLCVGLLWSQSYAAQTTTTQENITLTVQQGMVEIKSNGVGKWMRVSQDTTPVFPNDEIQTRMASKAQITYKDGKILTVQENTHIRLGRAPETTKQHTVVELHKGLIYANVPKDKKKPFQIQTAIAVAGVEGTQFAVKENDGKTGVSVLEGQVRFSTAKEDKEVMVSSLEKADILSWDSLQVQVTGTGFPPENLIRKQGTQPANAQLVISADEPIIATVELSDPEQIKKVATQGAQEEAMNHLWEHILAFRIDQDDTRISDLVSQDTTLKERIYSLINDNVGVEVSVKDPESDAPRALVTLTLNIGPILEALPKKMQTYSTVVKKISSKEYAKLFGPQAMLTAERAAKVDGYRRLAEYVQGFQIDSTTFIRDYLAEHDVVKTKLESFIKGITPGPSTYYSDGLVEVAVGLDGPTLAELVAEDNKELLGDYVLHEPEPITGSMYRSFGE